MKKRILSLFTAVTLVTSLLTAVPASAATNYKSLDLSLTQTSYTELNATGSIKAYLIAEEAVTMPVLSYDTNSNALLLNDDGTYQITAGTEAILPQRKAITEGVVKYTTDDTSVITLNDNGTFTTVGYGVANVNVVYDNNTSSDTTDDVSSNVMITVSDISKLEVYPGKYTGGKGITLLRKLNGETASGVNGRSSMYAWFRPVWDPVGTIDDPLVLKSNDSEGRGDATAAVAVGETAVFSGWFYDTMQNDSQNFMSFGYAGRTDAGTGAGTGADITKDGNSSITIAAQNASAYKLLGGVYSSSFVHTNYNYGKFNDGATSAAGARAGVSNAGTRSVGWHQFVVTAETSIVNPGTDYMLIKAYLDGELITAQDIYVGNVPVEKRRFNIYGNQRAASTNADVYYKDLSVRTFKRTGTIVETIPSNNAVNVPLRQMIKVKLASAQTVVPDVSVSANGASVSSSAVLDATGTVVTIDAGKLTAGAQYVVSVEEENFTFIAGTDSEMATMIDSMTDYKINDTRYVDFADTDKTAEEYGVGYVHNVEGTASKVEGTYLTMTEKTRTATSNDHVNGIIIRNISPRNGDADRVVVSYKFRPKTTATDPASASAGIGIPYMAVDDTDDAYNNLKTGVLSGGKYAGTLPSSQGLASAGYNIVEHSLLVGNKDGSTTAYADNGTTVSNGRFYIPASTTPSAVSDKYVLTADSDGWYRLTYVIDVDKNGVKAPTWTTIWGNDFDDSKSIFKLTATPVDNTAYTSVDAIYIPTTKKAAVKNDIITDIKDIEVYQLSKKIQASIDEQPVVTEVGTGTEVLASDLEGKTVDVSINAQGNGETYTFVVAAITDNNKLLNVKTGNGTLGTSANIGVNDFEVPQAENDEIVKLYVFVWNSFEDATPLFKKIEYTKAQ